MVKAGARGSAPKYALVSLDYRTTQVIAGQPAAPLASLSPASSDAPIDMIAAGDILAVSVFEAGSGGLVERPPEVATAGGGQPLFFPRMAVDSRGVVSIPFAGDVRVAGLTPRAAADAVRRAFARRAVDPQVTVAVVESPANSVAVIGEVRSAGRFPLIANGDRLLDVIALAGGVTKPIYDVDVVVARGERMAQTRFSELLRDAPDNIRLAPHDQIRLIFRPRKYATVGALGRNTQYPIEDETVTLAAAVSRAGGVDFTTGDGGTVLVFRFERPVVASALGVTQPPSPRGVPIIYKVNLRSPDGYLVANSFLIQADDLIYVPRAGIVEARQFLEIVNLLSATTYNLRVTTVLP
jgi:polysaccharide export outer membrane protein